MGSPRSLKIKRSLSRISFRQEKGVPTDHPPVPALDVDSIDRIDHREPVFERPIYLQPLAARSLSDSPGTSRRTSAVSPTSTTFPTSVPASPTRTEPPSRSIDLLAAHLSLARTRQRSNPTIEQTSDFFPNRADRVSAHQLVVRQDSTAPPPKPDNMFTQANMVLVEQETGNDSAHAQPTTSRAPLGTTAAAGQQTLDRSSFFKRIFSRQSKSPKNQSPLEQSPHDEFDFSQNGSNIPKMGPSPHTHPLLSKPYARDEVLHCRPQSKLRNGLSESTLSIARRKGELALASRSGSIRSAAAESPEKNASVPNSPESHNDDSEEGEKAATNAVTKSKSVQEWGFFVKCYAEGRFNVSNPPDPPPQPPDFNYLVAPVPPDEADRLKAVEQVVVNYPDWARSKAHHLVHLARKVFGTCYASISFVDGQSELMKAGYGYQTSSIPRNVSFGAHVVLSTNSMIILDAEKDWRLVGNPLVTAAPHIRFYAGSPLITPEGHVVGVFAVFDTAPRNDFPLHLRRKLADFTKIASADIEILIEEQEISKQKVHEPTTVDTTVDDKAETLSLKAKRLTTKLLQKIEEESKQAQGVSTAGAEARTSQSEHTIPHELFVQDDKLGKPQMDLPEPLNVSSKSLTRTWNGGSSVAITPPQTPSRTSAASEESSLKQTAATTPSSTNRSLSLSSDYERPYVSRKHRKTPPRPLKDMTKLGSKLDMPDDQPQPRSPGPVSSLTEAGFALSLIASTLGYDLVYLLRVRPNPEWEGTEFTEFESLSTRILVAHGLPQPEPMFDPLIHLRALKSEGGVIYQNPNQGSDGVEDDLGYGVGVLLPLLRDNVDELPLVYTTSANESEQEAERMAAKIEAYGKCKGGIVLAAFKKQTGPGHDFGNDEVAYLREMGSGMKDIFINGDVLASPNLI